MKQKMLLMIDVGAACAIGLARTLRDIGPVLLQTCVVGPLVGKAVARGISGAQSGSGRLAGVRALARQSVDGAILAGTVPGAGAKFAIPNGLPGEGERRLIIENEPHRVDGFNGVIKEGYGKGTKTLLYHGPVIVKVGGKTSVETADYHHHVADKAGPHFDLAVTGVPSQQFSPRPKQVELHFFQGPLAGRRYSIVNTIMKEGEGGRMILPMKDRGIVASKPDLRLKDREWLTKQHQNQWIAERKMDGSLASAAFSSSGRTAFRSHRDSGKTYYDKLPKLEFVSNSSRLLTSRLLFPRPSLNGTLLRGEIVHRKGAAKTSGILNSHPDRARAYQEKNGAAEYYAWDIDKYKGRDVSGWDYARRRGLLEKVIDEIRQLNDHYHVVEKARPGELPAAYYDRVVADRRGLPFSEGVVLKDRSNPANWVKVKAQDAYDLPIAGFIEGSGKYKGSLGALRVVNPQTGEAGEVGSFAISDADRKWVWRNREGLTGAVARITALTMTERGVPRAGVFQDFHENKGSEEALAVLAAKEI